MIRHPQPLVDAGVCYGRTDLTVDNDDVSAAALRLKALVPESCPVWSSPLTRCRELAVRLGSHPHFDERLMEMDFGAWEMKTWDEIGHVALDAWTKDPLDFKPPRGESVSNFRKRVAEFLTEVVGHNAPVILVTHCGVMRVVVSHLLGDAAVDWMRMHFEFSTVSLIENGKGGHRLAWHNR